MGKAFQTYVPDPLDSVLSKMDSSLRDLADYVRTAFTPYGMSPAYASAPAGYSPRISKDDDYRFPQVVYMSGKKSGGRQNPGGVGDVASHVQTAVGLGILKDAAVGVVTAAIVGALAHCSKASPEVIMQAAASAGLTAPMARRLAGFLWSHGHHKDTW